MTSPHGYSVRWMRTSALLALATLSAACGGGKTGGSRPPWLWPMYQRTSNRAGQAEAEGPQLGTIAWSTRLESSGTGLIVTEGELVLVRFGESLSAYTRDG